MDQYRVLDLVGKGSFGVVRKIQRRSDGRILVWKELNYGSSVHEAEPASL